MPDTIACSAELTVNRPRAATLALFTAEGERTWVPGWNPAFPAPQRTEGPGAVFVTAHAGETTTWVTVDQDEHGVRYARVTPGTARTERARLETFAEGFATYIEHWETAIAALAPADRQSR